jgi:hypothetical protein
MVLFSATTYLSFNHLRIDLVADKKTKIFYAFLDLLNIIKKTNSQVYISFCIKLLFFDFSYGGCNIFTDRAFSLKAQHPFKSFFNHTLEKSEISQFKH